MLIPSRFDDKEFIVSGTALIDVLSRFIEDNPLPDKMRRGRVSIKLTYFARFEGFEDGEVEYRFTVKEYK